MANMMDILRAVDGLAVGPVTPDTDKQNQILCQELPFRIKEYVSGREFNGWTVPKNWEVIKAEIRKDGQLVYDGKKHPLGVIGYSESFTGIVSLSELKLHLYHFKDAPNDIVYHCDLYYKPHLKQWGFSLPYNVYKELADGDYEIELVTRHTDGKMKVLEYTHPGASDKTIILNAHNCHAAQLNDGPSGYAAGIEAMRRLGELNTRYSYRLIVAPEHFGTVFYLADLPVEEIKKFKLGIFLEMLGNDHQFSLQESFTGKSYIDEVAGHVLKHHAPDFRRDKFRQVVGNDESVWEAPGYEVPMISLSRCAPGRLYPEYHLSSDNLSIMRADKLNESVDIIMKMIEVLEKDCVLQRKFTGLIALSNPKYDLYIAPGTDPAIQNHTSADQAKWSDLMNCAPRYFDQSLSILDIAVRHDLPFASVYAYLSKFKEKGLVDFVSQKLF